MRAPLANHRLALLAIGTDRHTAALVAPMLAAGRATSPPRLGCSQAALLQTRKDVPQGTESVVDHGWPRLVHLVIQSALDAGRAGRPDRPQVHRCCCCPPDPHSPCQTPLKDRSWGNGQSHWREMTELALYRAGSQEQEAKLLGNQRSQT